MKSTELLSELSEFNYNKTEKQKQNLSLIGEIAEEFHKKSGTYTDGVKKQIDLLKSGGDIMIIEAAHQPNFLPYYGVWKKAVFANTLANALNNLKIPAIALFGMSDLDHSTNPFLFQNKIPFAPRKDYKIHNKGYKKVGFKIKDDKWKLWCLQPIPSEDDINKQVEEITSIYTLSGLFSKDNDLTLFEDLMQDSFFSSPTFSIANAKLFSKICNNIWKTNLLIFPYSEVQKKGVFIEEFKWLFKRRKEYIDIYNKVIRDRDLELHELSQNHVPFWYHCECGSKMRIEVVESDKSMDLLGICRSCKKKHQVSLTDLNSVFSRLSNRMNPEAVTRNLIYSIGMGVNVYVSGLGGGLEYGQISDTLYETWNITKPINIAWKSKDNYLSVVVSRAISDFKKDYPNATTQQDFFHELRNKKKNMQVLYEKVLNHKKQVIALRNELKNHKPDDKKFSEILEQLKLKEREQKMYMGELLVEESFVIRAENISNAMSVVPSIIDEFLSVGFNNLINAWVYDLKKNDYDVVHSLTLQSKFENSEITKFVKYLN